MYEPLASSLLRLRRYALSSFDMDGMKRLTSTLDIKTDCVHHAISAGNGPSDRWLAVYIRFDRFDLGIVGPEQLSASIGMSRRNANGKSTSAQVADCSAAKKAGPAKHDDQFACLVAAVHTVYDLTVVGYAMRTLCACWLSAVA